MANVGAVVRRDEEYGVVIAISNSNFDAIKVEWANAKDRVGLGTRGGVGGLPRVRTSL